MKESSSGFVRYLLIGFISYLILSFFPFGMFLSHPPVFSYVGAVICIAFNILGTSKGMLSISNTDAGISLYFPKVPKKSLIGIIICETNLLCGLVMSYWLINTPAKNLQAAHCLLTAGIITGTVGYASSLSTGLICAAVNITDVKEPGLFSKMVFFEFLAGSFGVLGLALGFLCKEKAKNFL